MTARVTVHNYRPTGSCGAFIDRRVKRFEITDESQRSLNNTGQSSRRPGQVGAQFTAGSPSRS